jgi:hypothetical protein
MSLEFLPTSWLCKDLLLAHLDLLQLHILLVRIMRQGILGIVLHLEGHGITRR